MNVNLRIKTVCLGVETITEHNGIDPKYAEEILARKDIVWAVFF